MAKKGGREDTGRGKRNEIVFTEIKEAKFVGFLK